MKKFGGYFWLWGIVLSLVVGMYGFALWFGFLNQDEGWYLYAGRLVSEGKLPFVDFASTQGPVMAYVYALAQPLVAHWGVAGGRLFTALMGLATALVAAHLAYSVALNHKHGLIANKTGDISSRPEAAGAALLAFGLLGLNLYQVYFTTIVKTYSLAGLLVMCGFLALYMSLNVRRRWGACGLSFLAGGLIALAAGVRFSAGILLPVIWIPLAFSWWKKPAGLVSSRTVGGFLVGGSLVLLAVYVPLIIMAPAAVRFGLLEYHSGREVGSLAVLLAYKGGFVMRQAGAYFPLVVAGCGALMLTLHARKDKREGCFNFTQLLLGSVVAVSLVHLSAKFPYDDYQVFIMPLLVVVVSIVVAPLLARSQLYLWAAVLLMAVHSAASPMLQDWMLAKRDRIWWPLRSETQLQGLQRAADEIKKSGRIVAGDCATLLTQDTYLAVAAGMRVPAGMELGPFCYFPAMERERAEKLHVLNHEMLLEILRNADYAVAAFSGYGLSIACPQVMPLTAAEQAELWSALSERYKVFAEEEVFGQADTRLRMLRCEREKL
jgi:hypothetical protein